MISDALRIAAVAVTGILAGILFGDWAGASSVRATLPEACFIRFQQGLHVHFVPLMPILLFTSVITNAISALLCWRSNRRMAICFGIAAMAIAVALVMTRTINVPINEMLMTWKPESPPSDLWQTWQRWERSHTIRTIIAVLAFAVQCITLSLHSPRGSFAGRPQQAVPK